VKFGDLDLRTDAGKGELLNRLSKAADRVCLQNAMSLDALGMPAVHVSCYRHTLAAAMEKVHHAQASARFTAATPLNTR